jgi:hypothetical protein
LRLKWLSFRELGMKKLISLLVVAIFSASLAVTAASAKTAKECLAEWRADKAGMQARGTTEKAYVDQCKDGAAPTATAPAPAAPTPNATAPKAGAGSTNKKTAKDCVAEWRADKAGMKARGTTEKAYVEQCRGGAEPTVAAPIAPKPPVGTIAPAPAAPAPTAQKPPPANPTPVARQPSAPPTGPQSGEYTDEAQAKAHCPGDTVVWANLSSKIYHFSGGKSYGNTKRGAYMCEKEAITVQYRASKNEKHP